LNFDLLPRSQAFEDRHFRNFKIFCAPPSLKWNWLLSHKVFMRRLSNRGGHFGKDQRFLPQHNRQACWNSPREGSDCAHGRAVGLGGAEDRADRQGCK
jgi:hypothetical protein